MYATGDITEIIEFLTDNIFFRFAGCLFYQAIGTAMRATCALLLADLFLYSCENEFLNNMIRSGHRGLTRLFTLCYRYNDRPQ